jgi:hypothetical protein
MDPVSFSSYLSHRFDASTAAMLLSQHPLISTYISHIPPDEAVVVQAMARLKREKRWAKRPRTTAITTKDKSKDDESRKRPRDSEVQAEETKLQS